MDKSLKRIQFFCFSFLILFNILGSVVVFGEEGSLEEPKLKIKEVEFLLNEDEDVYVAKKRLLKYISKENLSYETKEKNYQQLVESLKEDKDILSVFENDGSDLITDSFVIAFDKPIEDDELIDELMSSGYFRNCLLQYEQE